jgi:hypothetical protein
MQEIDACIHKVDRRSGEGCGKPLDKDSAGPIVLMMPS